MNWLETLREVSIIHEEDELYELFFLRYTRELGKELPIDLHNARDNQLIFIIDCKAYPMVGHFSPKEFIESIEQETPRSTINHKCYFCNRNKEDDYVTFMKGFLEAHESCEQTVRSNLQEFIENKRDIFTATVI